ncbi:nif-specific transcriptional activator NifA [Desulfurispira natronophila]|uniref:Nif-specific regulatory protein n=1 Tax=Desulfurispira natronophila TaxID=682562 RepID=A0A7W8DGL2_9BACT|nr:nif-specific transcriptional activator NifA [Desulfurispira natronophila]MBB5021616.1 Nif-specific regulatory protein [Desulfurispira natronophila]
MAITTVHPTDSQILPRQQGTMNNRITYYKLALDTVYEISRVLSASSHRNNALKNVLAVLANTFNMKRGMVLLYEEVSDQLSVAVSMGISQRELENLRYRSGEGIVGKVFKLGMPILIPDISEEPTFLNRAKRDLADEKLSFLAVPIMGEQSRIYGVLAVDRNVGDIYSYSTEFNLLKMISSLLASFFEKVRAIEEERQVLQEEKSRLQNEVITKFSFQGLIGQSKPMKRVFEKIRMVCTARSTVLIRGESGTGKEVVAKTIHFNSDRSKKPFIAVNCAAIPHDLVESEMFGYEKGAFTGAAAQKKGKFELANGGTIFLDEIGDIPLSAQSKLLRILQEREVERLGGTSTIAVDVRIIAATNKNLEDEVKRGNFRLDLYYRLNVVTVFLPPLRKRREDIPLLAGHILERLNQEYNRRLSFSPAAMSALARCNYPGNIRELENCIERAALCATDHTIQPTDVSCMRGEVCYSHIIESVLNEGFDQNGKSPQVEPSQAPSSEPESSVSPPSVPPRPDIPADEYGRIIQALEEAGWVQAKAARLLGVTVRQLNYRIKKYDIEIRKI